MDEYNYQEYPRVLYHGLFAPKGHPFQSAEETEGLDRQGWFDNLALLHKTKCCKADKYDWCLNKPIVYKDSDDKYYCLFHAPKGQKNVSLEAFNEIIIDEIQKIKISNDVNKLKQTCNFDGTIFEGDINFLKKGFSNIFPGINFSNATFNGETDFGSDNDFIIFTGEVFFSDTIFNGKVDFSGVEFSQNAYFFNSNFKDEVDFTLVSIKETVRFEGVDLSKIMFADTDLRKVDFINCTFRKRNGCEILYDESKLYEEENLFTARNWDKTAGFLEIVKEKYNSLRIYDHPDYPEYKQNINKVEKLYRQLKQKGKEEHNEPEVSKWYYKEKEMFRRSSHWRRFLPGITTLYRFSSGYGEEPARAGLMLLFLLVSISLLFGLAGLHSTQPPAIKIQGLKDFSKLLLSTLQYALFERNPDFMPDTLWGKYLKIIARILISLQTVLFALAVRNRFRR
jgi:uncharacterized protein YjbI with pentapeptide repeats